MIRVRVRKHDTRERRTSANAEHGIDDSLPRVDRAPDHATSIDEKRAAVGKIDQRRIALADIEDGDAQLAGRGTLPPAEITFGNEKKRDRDEHRREPPLWSSPSNGERSAPQDGALPSRWRRNGEGEPADSFGESRDHADE